MEESDKEKVSCKDEKGMAESKEDAHLMDFSEHHETSRSSTGSFARPHLSTDCQMVYEDSVRTVQVMSEMHRFYQDKRFCDIVLCVGGCRFPCHRIVLAASSMYFERMFSNGMTEATAKEVTLKDLEPSALNILIEFAYSSKLLVIRDTVLDIFEAADMLQFPTVRMFCQDYLSDQINKQNCLSFMLYADAYSCEPLYERAKMCAAQNYKDICKVQEFMALPKDHLIALLQEDNLEMEYEEQVYETVRDWVLHDEASRKLMMGELLQAIRLNFVSRWFLIEVISKDRLILGSPDAQHVIQRAKDQLLAQGHTYEFPWQLPPSRKCTGMTDKIIYLNTYDPDPREAEVFLFDAVNKSWSNTSKPCPLASQLSTMERVGETVLVIGGWTNYSGTKSLNERGAVNIIHEFRVMSIFPTLWYVGAHCTGMSRYLHSTEVIGNKLYLLGGFDEHQELQSSVLVTDQERQYRFDEETRLMFPVLKPAVAQHDGCIYVFGGYDSSGAPMDSIPVQMYNTETQQWSELPPICSNKKVACQYATYINGLFYIFCGNVTNVEPKEDPMVGHKVPPRYIDSIFTFNPVSKVWDKIYTFQEARSGDFSITAMGGKVYLTGGLRNEEPYLAVDCYDPTLNTIEIVGTIRDGHGSLTLCTTIKVMHENFGL